MRRKAKVILLVAVALLMAGCDGVQSALAPEGLHAERSAFLFWTMAIGATAIFVALIGLTAFALLAPRRSRRWMAQQPMLFGAGVVFPVVTLSFLLVYGFVVTGAPAPGGGDARSIRIAVDGRRWWWQVTYWDEDNLPVVTANELRIPAGQTVAIELTSADVIHSFWIPKLAGKLDMIPGRVNVLTLNARGTGVMRGQCAEYCGGAHALMSFNVVVMTPEAFRAWLRQERSPAQAPANSLARQGKALFFTAGCSACHAIRGTAAANELGPDLTHVGGRTSIGAATLGVDKADFARWISDNQRIKPGNLMPDYGIFTPDQLEALASYLAGLQ
ncbi:cytochrome c oxidase subunit II [Methylocystis echinoides]|uniref:Cytochrome aa3 subunit 2 n=1 Tax=Methylocystis echinoides TaxID=29468 RepID=A0A9W6GV01_9HYPH|nr:cytochrome c oxidase subunit II [Methylocystis echinoides]GLI93379.1 cytochrome c oxidase subunit II [Methylocystis echinoides]